MNIWLDVISLVSMKVSEDCSSILKLNFRDAQININHWGVETSPGVPTLDRGRGSYLGWGGGDTYLCLGGGEGHLPWTDGGGVPILDRGRQEKSNQISIDTT